MRSRRLLPLSERLGITTGLELEDEGEDEDDPEDGSLWTVVCR